jgi:hypothetical protein
MLPGEEYYVVRDRFTDVDGAMKLPGERVLASSDRAMLLRQNGKIGGLFLPPVVETATTIPVSNPERGAPVVKNAMAQGCNEKRKKKGR